MDDTAPLRAHESGARPTLDFQEHLAPLEAAGPAGAGRPPDQQGHRAASAGALAVRRRHRRGGSPRLPLHQRRRCRAASATTSRSRWARSSASPQIYALGMGRAVEEIGPAWLDAIDASDPAGHRVESPRLPGGGDEGRRSARARWRPQALAGAGLDAGFRQPRPISPRPCASPRIPRPGVRNMGMYRAALKAPDRLARAHGARVGGAGGYLHWLKYRDRKENDADRHRARLRPGGGLYLAAETRDRSGRDGDRRRARRPGHSDGQGASRSISKCRPMPRSSSRA